MREVQVLERKISPAPQHGMLVVFCSAASQLPNIHVLRCARDTCNWFVLIIYTRQLSRQAWYEPSEFPARICLCVVTRCRTAIRCRWIFCTNKRTRRNRCCRPLRMSRAWRGCSRAWRGCSRAWRGCSRVAVPSITACCMATYLCAHPFKIGFWR
jgi:hypothetical protein